MQHDILVVLQKCRSILTLKDSLNVQQINSWYQELTQTDSLFNMYYEGMVSDISCLYNGYIYENQNSWKPNLAPPAPLLGLRLD